MPSYFDSHAHVQFAAYDEDREAVIQRALDGGVSFINVGTQRDTSEKAVLLAEKHEGVFAAVGLHPIHTEKSYHDAQELGVSDMRQATSDQGFFSRGETFDRDFYLKLGVHQKVVAVGECGLDYFRVEKELSKQLQKDVFVKHIDVAEKLGKPLMCHCRPSKNSDDAYDDLYLIVQPRFNALAGGVIHFFVGTVETAKRFLELGFYFTFGGVITFARNYDEVIRYLPLDRILLETDAPYVTPVPYRGKRNEPLYIVETARKMAELKLIPMPELVDQVARNNQKIFKFKIAPK